MIEIPKNYFDVAIFLVASQPWLCRALTRGMNPPTSGTVIASLVSIFWIGGALVLMLTGAKP